VDDIAPSSHSPTIWLNGAIPLPRRIKAGIKAAGLMGTGASDRKIARRSRVSRMAVNRHAGFAAGRRGARATCKLTSPRLRELAPGPARPRQRGRC
jgi:hypothetical protein